MHDACGVGSDISEALNGDRGILDIHLKVAEGLERHADHPTTRSFFTPKTPSDRSWFAGNDTRHGKANLLAVGVHDPGHDLRVCPDVWSRNILVWTDQWENLGRIPAGQALEVPPRQFLWRERPPPLCTPPGENSPNPPSPHPP